MVDVSPKKETKRIAQAEGFISMKPETLALIESGETKKGDVLACARIAGIMAAKKTSDLIPLCHPLMLTNVEVTSNLIIPPHQMMPAESALKQLVLLWVKQVSRWKHLRQQALPVSRYTICAKPLIAAWKYERFICFIKRAENLVHGTEKAKTFNVRTLPSSKPHEVKRPQPHPNSHRPPFCFQAN